MDKRLELRVLEEGYDPKNAEIVDLQAAIGVIQKNYAVNRRFDRSSEPAILFDGTVELRAEFGHYPVYIHQDDLIIEAYDNEYGGLTIRSLRSTIYRGDYFCITLEKQVENEHSLMVSVSNLSDDYLKLDLTSSPPAHFSFMAPDKNTRTLKLPKLGWDQNWYERIWDNVSEQIGVDSIRAYHPGFFELSSWYDPKTNIGFVTGTTRQSPEVFVVLPKSYPPTAIERLVKKWKRRANIREYTSPQSHMSHLAFCIGYQGAADIMTDILRGAEKKSSKIEREKITQELQRLTLEISALDKIRR